MIPTPEQLKSIAQMRRGNLAEIPFGILLHALAVHRQTVVLEIERPPLKKTLILEHGNPVECRSNLLHETLSRFMATKGWLEEEESQGYFNRSVAEGIPFGELLTREGKITAGDLYKVLQQNLAKKLLDVFSWRSGEFHLHSDVPAVDSPLQVNAPQLVVTGIVKFALAEEVNGAVGPLVGKRLVLHPSPPFSAEDLHLSNEQRRLLDLLRQGKRIDELAAETTVPFERIMRLLYAMAVIGIVVDEEQLAAHERAPADAAPRGEVSSPTAVGSRAADAKAADTTAAETTAADDAATAQVAATGSATAGAASNGAAAAAAAAKPAASAPSVDAAPSSSPGAEARNHDSEHNQLMEAYLRYRKQDAFELLGLEETASQEEIERRYVTFSQRFAPWKFDVSGLSGLVEKAEDLFLAGGRAFGELSDTERRNALLKRRQTLRQEGPRAPARDRFMIKSELLDPVVQYRKGKALLQKQLYREAAQQLQFAVDCDPQNSLYRSELAYGKYMSNPDLESQAALEALEETLRIDPKCGMAVFYGGQILADLEQYKEAERKLRLAIKMMMPDRRPIEALKAMQAHQKSKKKRRFV